MSPNRAERRRAAREGTVTDGRAHGYQYRAHDHDDDRVLVGLRNIEPSEHLINSAFDDLHQIMGLIDIALRDAATADQSQWFPNNVAALACLGRAYQGLQACAVLCTTGLYLDARATIRVVYESAGLARALAKSTADAEKWLHESHWKSDGFSRKIGAEMSVDRKASRRSYEEYYKHTSAYAHPSATSVLPLVFGRESGHGFGVRLYPDVDDKTFRAVAREITAVAIFTAFALVRAAAEVEVFPPEWLRRLDELATAFDGSFATVRRDWDEYGRRHEAMTAQVRHDDELSTALDNDPDSVRNRRRTYLASKTHEDKPYD